MEAEKYVNSIVKKIKCTNTKKKEIKTQLLSDIAMRQKAGESMEQIMESMGTAEEIAEAFGQNLSEADKKAYRWRRIWMTIGSIVLVLFFLCLYVWWLIPKAVGIASDERFTQEKITAEVEKVIELLDENDYESLQEISVEEMRAILNQETVGGVKDAISTDWGELQSIGNVYAGGVKQKGKLIIVTQVDAIYENVSVVYTISFDENMELAGLYMR
ncbi:MAG: DUF3887 domain-containing protein [Lachnospiraceae bacterium]|nr:DUF3887 domain-containing protein [Lachnospiraceae bacterium]